MLALQGLFGAFTTGAASAGPMFDAFGNPLCITSGIHDPGSFGHTHEPGSVPECCAGACSLIAAPAFDTRADAFLSNPLPPAAPGFAPFCAFIIQPAFDHDPGSPRAPPANV